jgi:hypothetical protein
MDISCINDSGKRLSTSKNKQQKASFVIRSCYSFFDLCLPQLPSNFSTAHQQIWQLKSRYSAALILFIISSVGLLISLVVFLIKKSNDKYFSDD